MCRHKWIEINDLSVCKRCGLTLDKKTGKVVMFDRAFINAGKQKKGRRRK